MNFTFVTLFPNLIDFYFKDSILKIASEKKLVSFKFYNPRDFTKNKHLKVDAPMCSGGAGMLMTPQPLFDTLDKIKEETPDAHIIFPLAAAKPFKQNDAKRLGKSREAITRS